MNKNTRARFNVSHDAFARVKHARTKGTYVTAATEAAAAIVGVKPRLSKHPKVAAHRAP